MTNTVEPTSDIAAIRKETAKISLHLGLQIRQGRAFVIPMLEPEQPFFSEKARAGYTTV